MITHPSHVILGGWGLCRIAGTHVASRPARTAADQYYVYVEGGQAKRRATNRWSNIAATDCRHTRPRGEYKITLPVDRGRVAVDLSSLRMDHLIRKSPWAFFMASTHFPSLSSYPSLLFSPFLVLALLPEPPCADIR